MNDNAPEGITQLPTTCTIEPNKEVTEVHHEKDDDPNEQSDDAPEVQEPPAANNGNRHPESVMLDQPTSRYSRTRRLTRRLQEAIETRVEDMVLFQPK